MGSTAPHRWPGPTRAGYNGCKLTHSRRTAISLVSGAVHVRRFNCRGVRLDRLAAFLLALAAPAFAANAQATQTRLSTETHDRNGHTQAALSVAVSGEDGTPGSGNVTIEDAGKPVAGAVLTPDGTAKLNVDLPPGAHDLRAVYAGDLAHSASASDPSPVRALAGSTPDFSVAVNPASMSLAAGQTGTATATVTPLNAAALTAPMFVTLSCSGMPDQSSCAFTPENVEILPNATAPIVSSMVVTTEAPGTRGTAISPARSGSRPVSWAVLIPGALALAGLGFAARRRRWLSRLSLLAILGFVTVLGTTACSPRYNYFNHGPPYNLPTPAGSYTVTIAAQSSNGVTANTHTITFALTVK
ncbi:Ig-like domain repeat protein [Acidobacteria bacterium AB60]|nr:Ig-like domain repeat protein [Acidobacteria bacterium AB60]